MDAPKPSAELTAEFSERGLEAESVFPIVYDELRRIARRQVSRPDDTLQATSLVHEAYLKLCPPDRSVVMVKDRAHFCALAATAMRQILIDRARRRAAQKRGGDLQRVTLTGIGADLGSAIDAIDLDAALQALGELDGRQLRIVELHSFGGLSHAQIADYLGVSLSTVEKGWRAARAWLSLRLRGSS